MQITNTSIRHKRYSTYGWNVKNLKNEYINTLNQGEIGVLLGDDKHNPVDYENDGSILKSILEIRIGQSILF